MGTLANNSGYSCWGTQIYLAQTPHLTDAVQVASYFLQNSWQPLAKVSQTFSPGLAVFSSSEGAKNMLPVGTATRKQSSLLAKEKTCRISAGLFFISVTPTGIEPVFPP